MIDMNIENRDKFTETMAGLFFTFDKEIQPAVIKIYWGALQDFSDEQVFSAIDQSVKTCKFMPKPSELIELIEGTPSEKGIEQWGKVMLFLKKEGSYGDPNRLGEDTFNVIQKMGGWKSICACDYRELDFKKKHFLDLYVSNDNAVKRLSGPDMERIT